MSNNLGIDRIIGTPTEREIVDGIKEISLSHAIMSYQTIDFGRQLQIGALYIFKVNNGNIEDALKRFKRQCARNGVLQEVRKREHYEKPSVKRKKKSEAARKTKKIG